MTVLGPVPYGRLGITDAHNHVWIEPVAGVGEGSPVLDEYGAILTDLCDFRLAGGGSLLDCQPGGCGRNGNQMARLSRESGVNLVACTGFHRQKYYPPDAWLFSASAEQAAEYFIREITHGLEECDSLPDAPRAGFIKIALEGEWKDTPQAALEGAAQAAARTGALLEIHTEKGRLAERAVTYFCSRGVEPHQVVLCHMDKRPDTALHAELARFGALLEYDTFYRPKYEPESRLWPLIAAMAHSGLGRNVALATDMAESAMYRSLGGGPGLASLPGDIKTRLEQLDIPSNTIQEMLGGNIARRLAGLA